jgi:hypothetical protein
LHKRESPDFKGGKMENFPNTNAFDAGVKEKKHENKQNYNC